MPNPMKNCPLCERPAEIFVIDGGDTNLFGCKICGVNTTKLETWNNLPRSGLATKIMLRKLSEMPLFWRQMSFEEASKRECLGMLTIGDVHRFLDEWGILYRE